jgi:DNA polymerase elongation subunit (family B)
MIDSIDLGQVLFLDLECVTAKEDFAQLDEIFKDLWSEKAGKILRKSEAELGEEEVATLYTSKGAIFAEFGKIICISVGFLRKGVDDKFSIRLKSFAGHDEALLLKDFCEMLRQHFNKPDRHFLCGHNIKEFDVPYICRRLVYHQLEFPELLKLFGKKPWETKYLLDTMELWRFGDVKHYTSLKLLAATLGFPSPKEDIDGGDVGRVYWKENDIERISKYCEKDVLATAQLMLRYKKMPLLESDHISHV